MIARDRHAQELDAAGDLAAWTTRRPDGYVVKIADSSGIVRARIAPARVPFIIDVGTWASRASLVYARCEPSYDAERGYGCRLFRYDLAARRESRIRRAHAAGCEEQAPSTSSDKLVFARTGPRCVARGLYLWRRGSRPERIHRLSRRREITTTDVHGEVVAYAVHIPSGTGSREKVRAQVGPGPFTTLASTFSSAGSDFIVSDPQISGEWVYWLRRGRAQSNGSTIQRRVATAAEPLQSATRSFEPAFFSFGFFKREVAYARSGVYRVSPPLEFKEGGV